MLPQDVFQSFDFVVIYAQDQKIEKPPGVTSGTLKVKRLKNILE
jgi:hypothetical protein